MNTNFRNTWKQLAHEKKLTRYDMALLCLVKAIQKDNSLELARKHLSRSFTPATNPNKINHGHYPYYSLWDALHCLGCSLAPAPMSWSASLSASLRATLTDEEKAKIVALIPLIAIGYQKVVLHD